MVVLEHQVIGGKNNNSDEKTRVKKIAELGRRCWRDDDVDEVVGTMINDGCHYEQHLRMNKGFGRLLPKIIQ